MQNTMRALGILGTVLMGILTVLEWLLDKIEAAFIIAIGVGAAYFAITIPLPALWVVTLLAAGALFLNLVLDITFF